MCACTWKTLGADTRQAKAEERVAPKIPAVMRGPKADTMLMDCRQKHVVHLQLINWLFVCVQGDLLLMQVICSVSLMQNDISVGS